MQFSSHFSKIQTYVDKVIEPTREYAEKKGLMPQLRRMLIYIFELTIGAFLTPLPLFYLELGLYEQKITASFSTLLGIV